jgi:hypothetical protein
MSRVLSPIQMGTKNSKEDTAKKDVVVTDSSTKMVENSSGFHMIEIHMPSMGMGLLIIGIGVLAFLAYRWRRASLRHRRELQRSGLPLSMWSSPSPYGYRFSPYPPARLEEIPDPERRPAPRGLPQPDLPEAQPGCPAMARM